MQPPLTERQKEILRFIVLFFAENLQSPTVREICVQFGIGSPNGVFCHIKAMRRKGYLTLGKKRSSRRYIPTAMIAAMSAAADEVAKTIDTIPAVTGAESTRLANLGRRRQKVRA